MGGLTGVASTGSQVSAVQPEYASRLNRLFGQMLDAIIGVIPLLVVLQFVGYEGGGVVGLTALLAGVYYLFADGLPDGQSYGKRLLGMTVRDATSGLPCSVWQSFIRNLLLALLGPIDWLFIFGNNHQRLGDRAAGTIVVRVH